MATAGCSGRWVVRERKRGRGHRSGPLSYRRELSRRSVEILRKLPRGFFLIMAMLLSLRNYRDALGEISDFRPAYTSFGKPRVKPHEKSATHSARAAAGTRQVLHRSPPCVWLETRPCHSSSPQDLPIRGIGLSPFFSQHARAPHFSAPAARTGNSTSRPCPFTSHPYYFVLCHPNPKSNQSKRK